MGDTTIAWTDKTWNPTTGCSKISQGCKNCYAERIFHRPYPGRLFTDVRCHPERLDQPLRWRKPCRVFVNSMSDLFHEDIPQTFIAKVFEVMNEAHWHTFQVLTKRPERMLKMLSNRVWPWAVTIENKPQPNVWLGVSVEDQATADERIPLLLQTPAAVRFVSFEPALAAVDWGNFLPLPDRDLNCRNCGKRWTGVHRCERQIEWIIVGGESGPKARPFNIEWARYTIRQSGGAGVPVFIKQIGRSPCVQPDSKFAPLVDFGLMLKDRAGADPAEWPEDLRVQEYPA